MIKFTTPLESGMIIHCKNKEEAKILYEELKRISHISLPKNPNLDTFKDFSIFDFNDMELNYELCSISNGGWSNGGWRYTRKPPTHELSDLIRTVEIDIDKLKPRTTIHCPTKENAIELLKVLKQQGYVWTTSFNYSDEIDLDVIRCAEEENGEYSPDTGYRLLPDKRLSVQNIGFIQNYSARADIVEFSDILCSPETEKENDASNDFGRIFFPTLEEIKNAVQIVNDIDARARRLAKEVGLLDSTRTNNPRTFDGYKHSADFNEITLIAKESNSKPLVSYTCPAEWLYESVIGIHKGAYLQEIEKERAEYLRLKAKFEPEAESETELESNDDYELD